MPGTAMLQPIPIPIRRPICSAVCALALLTAPACDREPPPALHEFSVPTGPPMSLRETYDRLREWRAKRAYLAMRPYIDPACRDEVIDLLIAVDELFAADAGARAAIHQACPDVAAEQFGLAAQIADSLELFSTQVEFISQREEGGRGWVTVQIAGGIPLTHINFERRRGYWVYLPGPVGRDVVPVIREMAGTLNRIALVASTRPRTREELEEEYRFRLGPKLKRFAQLAAEAR